MTYADTYELSTGLPDDVIFNIGVGSFGTDAGYNNGQTMLLKLTGYVEGTEETMTHLLSVGGDWSTVDGTTIQHPNGKNKINNQSSYGRWLTAAREIPALWEYLINKGPATDAKIWNNLKLHLVREFYTSTFRGETTQRTRLTISEFLGFVDGGQQSLPLTTQQSAAPLLTPVPSQPTVETQTPEQILAAARAAQSGQSPLRASLLELAKVHPTHNEFVAAAVNNPDVMTDDALLGEVMNPTGLYLEARK